MALNRLKKISDENKVLIQNFSSLSILQFSNYLFPLIAFPYLVRVLGPEKFGLVNFAAAFVGYFTVLVDYGFNLSATQEISVHRNESGKIDEIFSGVMIVKSSLFLVGFIIFSLLVLSIPKFSVDAPVYFLSFLAVSGSVVFPTWFFQGMEKMKYITVITIGVKILWVVSVFLLIKSPSHILLYVLLNGISLILTGLIALLFIFRKFGIKMYFPPLTVIKRLLVEGWYVFVSTASITLYTSTNIFILGLFAGNEIVGYFAAADKIRIAVQGLFQNASQAIFPYLSKLFVESKEKAIRFVKKYLKLSLSFAIVVTFVLFAFSGEIVLLILGEKYMQSINVFRIIIFLPLIILLSNVYGIQIMLNLGYKKEFFRIIFLAGIINLILSFILVPVYFETGTAVAVLITEIFVTAGMYGFVRKKKILEL